MIISIIILSIIFLICLLFLLNHFSKIFSNEGFESIPSHFFSFFFPLAMLILNAAFSGMLAFRNEYHLSFVLIFIYHLLSFFISYSCITFFMYIIEFIEFILNVLRHSNKFKINIPHIISPSLNIYPICKNMKLIKALLLISYFISIILLKFYFQPYLLNNLDEFNLSIMKDTLDTYFSIFALSTLPILYSYFKK